MLVNVFPLLFDAKICCCVAKSTYCPELDVPIDKIELAKVLVFNTHD